MPCRRMPFTYVALMTARRRRRRPWPARRTGPCASAPWIFVYSLCVSLLCVLFILCGHCYIICVCLVNVVYCLFVVFVLFGALDIRSTQAQVMHSWRRTSGLLPPPAITRINRVDKISSSNKHIIDNGNDTIDTNDGLLPPPARTRRISSQLCRKAQRVP